MTCLPPKTRHGLCIPSMRRLIHLFLAQDRRFWPAARGIGSMQPENHELQLNLISTLWSLVCLAHHGPVKEGTAARQQLLERYGGAVRRSLRTLLPDPDAADEVF